MEPLEDEKGRVRRSRTGDAAAFEAIMEHYEPYVLSLLQRLTGDRARAEDLCQETFIRVLKGLPLFREGSGLKTWIYRIAHNTAVDFLRIKSPVEEPLEREDSGEERHANRSPGAHEVLLEKQLRQVLEQSLSALPPHPREILHLFYFDEMGIGEIARTMGVPEGTVKTHLFRGRRLLREQVLEAMSGSLP